MNNPFFDQARDGCMKAEAESGGKFKCEYIGPGEHGGGEEQVQVVLDLIAKKVDGIAVSPSNAAAMGKALEKAKAAGIPVLTWDSDLLDKDKALRIAYVGTKNYDIGVNLAKLAQEIKPKGGTICIQSGGAAAANHNERMQGIRDTLAGAKSAKAPGDRLTGQNGWTEVDGCPLYTDDDFPRAVQQMEDILGKYPKLDAFIPTGGFPQFIPQAYTKVAEKHKARIDSGELALVVADTLPVQMDLMKKGLSLGPGRPAAVRDGPRDHGLSVRDRDREEDAGRPDLHRPGRLHAQDRRYLHRRLTAANVRRMRRLRGCPRGRPASGGIGMTQHTLRAGELELVVDAARGGSIMAFRQRGFDLMRPWDGVQRRSRAPTPASRWCRSPAGSTMASFRFNGRSYALAANFPPEPHAIHGDGWTSPWQVVAANADQRRARAGPRRSRRRPALPGDPDLLALSRTGSRSR